MLKNKITLSQLESFLMKAADILRGKMDASEYAVGRSNQVFEQSGSTGLASFLLNSKPLAIKKY